MSSRWAKSDVYDEKIFPGDICVYNNQFIIYKGEAWGAKNSKGQFGRFITSDGVRSLKYTSVVFAFDPMGERRSTADVVRLLTRQFYEGEKK